MTQKQSLVGAAYFFSLALFAIGCGPSASRHSVAADRLETAKKDMDSRSWLSAIHHLDEVIGRAWNRAANHQSDGQSLLRLKEALDADPILAEAFLLRGTAINEFIADSISKREWPQDYSRNDALRVDFPTNGERSEKRVNSS